MTGEKQLWQVWQDMALGRMFQSFRLAVGPTKLAVALLALMIVGLLGWLMDICTSTVVVDPNPSNTSVLSIQDLSRPAFVTELDVFISDPAGTAAFIEKHREKSQGYGVFSTLWNFGAARFNSATMLLLRLDLSGIFANIIFAVENLRLCFLALLWAVKYHTVYSIIFFSIAFVVFCFAGGAICRCAAVELARHEKPGLTEAIRFSVTRPAGFPAAPLIPVGITLFLGFFVFLLGLAGNIPRVGELLVGLGLAGAMLIGALSIILLAGTVAGWGLMFPAIAYEGSNGRDAVGRAFHYVISQPWWMLFYTLAASIWGTISYLFVRFFVFLLLTATYIMLDMGMADSSGKLARIWPRPDFYRLAGTSVAAANWTESVAAFMIHLVVLLTVGLVVAFVISFYFCANTAIYSLMRRKVDGTATTRIFLQLDHLQENPQNNTDPQTI